MAPSPDDALILLESAHNKGNVYSFMVKRMRRCIASSKKAPQPQDDEMVRETITTKMSCCQCGTRQACIHTATARSEGLRFASSFHCLACGDAFESDDSRIPEDLRPLFYETHGKWALHLEATGPQKLHVLHSVRHVMGLSIQDAGELLKSLPSQLAEGTRVEMEVLRERLAHSGAKLLLKCDASTQNSTQ
ncbi:ribosomal protein L7/L12 [Myxococcus fulvus]|uniref:ribosomal protein L7/L12 n=1 Tax=Myxococcus fulvus TaxID=33 RepID=UPI003B9D32BB